MHQKKISLINIETHVKSGNLLFEEIVEIITATNQFFLEHNLYKNPKIYQNPSYTMDFAIYIEDLNETGWLIAKDAYQRYLFNTPS